MKRVFLTAVVVVTLAGCAGGPAMPLPTPTLSSTPSPTPTPSSTVTAPAKPVVAPTPLLQLSCAEVLSASTIGALSTMPMSEFSAITSNYNFGTSSPGDFALKHLQATQCQANNGLPMTDANGQSEDFTEITVRLLPNAKAAWAGYVAMYGKTAVQPPECNGEDRAQARCWWSGMAKDGTWVDIVFEGMKQFGSNELNEEQFIPVVDAVVAATIVSPRGAAWTPEPSLVLPSTCPGLLTADLIASTFGVRAKDVHFNDGPIGGTSVDFESEVQIGVDSCQWWYSGLNAEYGESFRVLAGGEWAWNEARLTDESAKSARPLALSGLKDGDSAWSRSWEQAEIIDLIIGGNWISLSLWRDDFPRNKINDAVMRSLAQGLVDAAR